MSVLERLKAMVKEAQEDIDNSQKRVLSSNQSKTEEASKPNEQASSEEDKIEKIQKYRKSASQTKESKEDKTEDSKSVKVEISEEKTENNTSKESLPDLEDLEPVEEDKNTELEIEDTSIAEESTEIVEDSTKEEDTTIEEESDNSEKIEETEEDINNEEENSEEETENLKTEKDKKSDNMTLLNDNDIYTMDDIDAEFHQKFLDAGVITVDHCFQCGTCGGGCPSGRRTPYRVRKLVRNCLLGLKDEVISDDALWMCTTCYTCQERCPRGVKIVDVVKEARRIASHAGYMAKAHKMTGVFVINTGHAVPINDATKEMRKNIGLPELPPTTHSFPEALKEVQDICKACEFDDLIGYDEATGGLKE